MREDIIATGVVMSKLNCFNLDSLSNRILLQKKFYLLQRSGINLGFQYNWYVHGPYSPDLTSAAYECMSEGKEAFQDFQLHGDVTKIIDKINNLINLKSSNKIDETSWYELLASYIYLRKENDVETAKNKLVSAKPKFSLEDANEAERIMEAFCRI